MPFLETSIIRYRNKAVADGAVSFYLDHFVSARISKHTHGIEIYAYYDAGDAEHRARTTSVDAAGLLLVSGRFSDILNKVNLAFSPNLNNNNNR